MDVDHFKLLIHGHPTGDASLIQIGEILSKMEKRPSVLFARYGGEESAFVFGNTTIEQALVPIDNIYKRYSESQDS